MGIRDVEEADPKVQEYMGSENNYKRTGIIKKLK